MIFDEFDEKKYVDSVREAGVEEGIAKGKFETILELVREGTIGSGLAANKLGVSEEEILAMI